jgi:hypothetical protein
MVCTEFLRTSDVSYALGIVALRPNIVSSVIGIQGRLKELGKDSVPNIPPVNPMKIFLPPPHINLELIKCLVKAMAKTNSKGFKYLSNKFPNTNKRPPLVTILSQLDPSTSHIRHPEYAS